MSLSLEESAASNESPVETVPLGMDHEGDTIDEGMDVSTETDTPIVATLSAETPPSDPSTDTDLPPPASATSTVESLSDTNDDSSSPDEDRRGRKRPLQTPADASTEPAANNGESIQSRFDSLSISELRSMGRSMSIDLSDCIERHEMIRRLSSGDNDSPIDDSHHDNNTTNSDNSNEHAVDPSLLQDWSVSEIRTVARLVKIDLVDTSSHQDMVQTLCRGMAERPHAGRFVQALVPFVGLSISQLRAAAREMRINLAGCLEKDDMMSRIVESQMARA